MNRTARIGDWVRDNDPRNNVPRVGKIIGYDGLAVLIALRASKRTVKVSGARIFADGKPRKSGWSVVEPAP